MSDPGDPEETLDLSVEDPDDMVEAQQHIIMAMGSAMKQIDEKPMDDRTSDILLASVPQLLETSLARHEVGPSARLIAQRLWPYLAYQIGKRESDQP